jgi:hypothetical protein
VVVVAVEVAHFSGSRLRLLFFQRLEEPIDEVRSIRSDEEAVIVANGFLSTGADLIFDDD